MGFITLSRDAQGRPTMNDVGPQATNTPKKNFFAQKQTTSSATIAQQFHSLVKGKSEPVQITKDLLDDILNDIANLA